MTYGLFISVINQLDAQNFCFTISLFHASTCFEHMYFSSGGQNCITQPLVSSHLYLFHNKFYFMPLHVSSTCAHHQEVKIALHNLWYHHTYIYFTISFISCLYMFRAHVLIIRRSKLHYTASGIITPVGVMIPEAV